MSPRIVSLLASATEIVCELGLEERLVGISHECDHPVRILDRPRLSRPRFDPSGLSSREVDRAVRRAMAEHGSVYEIDAARLEELEPDLIFTQAVCEVCAVPTAGLAEVVRERSLDARVVSLDAHTIEEILRSLATVGEAAGVARRAEELVRAAERRLQTVRDRASRLSGPRPEVLAIEWLDPPFAPGHWVPEMVEMAGGKNLAGETGAASRQVTWEELEGRDPDVLLVMPCGLGREEARREADAHAGRLRQVAPRAVAEGRAYVVDGSAFFNRSGPRVVTGVEILAGLLHPDLFPVPSHESWERWRPA